MKSAAIRTWKETIRGFLLQLSFETAYHWVATKKVYKIPFVSQKLAHNYQPSLTTSRFQEVVLKSQCMSKDGCQRSPLNYGKETWAHHCSLPYMAKILGFQVNCAREKTPLRPDVEPRNRSQNGCTGRGWQVFNLILLSAFF